MKKTIFYIGLNDKDTKSQKISTLEAADIVSRLVLGVGYPGATISESVGIYTHEDGAIVKESSLRVEILDSVPAKDEKLAQDFKKILNQESILKESQDVQYDFI